MARYDYNLIVIGAGSGGLVSAYIAASVKARVLLIEKHLMGGDCLNSGCIPSKTLIKSAHYAHQLKHGEAYGFNGVRGDVDFSRVMQRVRESIDSIAPNDSVERYQSLGVDCIIGEGCFVDAHTVEVQGQRYSARNIIVATGASPAVPPIPGLDTVKCLTSDNLWSLKSLPSKLVVVGGGAIGCELTQAFSRLGSVVTQVEVSPRLLAREDGEVSRLVVERFQEEGVRCLLSTTVTAARKKGDLIELSLRHDNGTEERLDCDALLLAVGRKANVEGFGLEELGVRLTKHNAIEASPFLKTNIPSIYVVGDVTGPYHFTHTASHQAWFAAVNSLFAPVRLKVDYGVIPRVTFTDPEIASVGLSESEATSEGRQFEVSRFELSHSDRAITEGVKTGWVKVLTPPGKDKILGATVVGPRAGEVMAELVLAMKHGLGLNKILGTIHAYPTYTEMNKSVAGKWRQANKPERVLALLKKWHRFRRG